MNDPISQTKEEMSGGAKANAEIHDSTGRVLGIVAFGIACIALGASIPGYLQMRDTRAELLQQLQQSENRVIADNREKTTAFTLLDSHYRELKAKFDAQESLNVRRR